MVEKGVFSSPHEGSRESHTRILQTSHITNITRGRMGVSRRGSAPVPEDAPCHICIVYFFCYRRSGYPHIRTKRQSSTRSQEYAFQHIGLLIMSSKYVKRVTLFKVPKEEDIDAIIAEYGTMRTSAQKVIPPSHADHEP